jgi:hexokinase
MSMKISIPSVLIGFVIAFLSMKLPLLTTYFKENSKATFRTETAILGDIGGTNLRLQLVSIHPEKDQPKEIYK